MPPFSRSVIMKLPMTARAFLVLLTLCSAASVSRRQLPAATDDRKEASLLQDSGFEAIAAGTLATTRKNAGWEIQRTGRDTILPRLIVAGVEDETRAKSGKRCLSLTIPKETVGFEFVTVGQRRRLPADKEYEASAWVRWPGGPDQAPKDASPISGHPSAIVSFWARHRDGTGDFAGRDEWLFDNQWKRLRFRFRPSDPDQPTLIYVSMLPNQKPTETTILLDDFEVYPRADTVEAESRKGNIIGDPDFARQKAGDVAAPWYFANMGGKGISCNVVADEAERFLTMAMGKATSNFESAQLWQHVDLREGVRYEVSCRMRWDNYAVKAPAPIVNFGIFHEESNTWYGPIDQVLDKSGDWTTYRFIHVPPYPGKWKLYVQLNGWGNFGNGVTVSFDDFTCVTSAKARP